MKVPSVEDVRKVAHLSRLRVDDAEAQRLATDVARVLDYVELLFAVEVEGIEPLRQPEVQHGALRPDDATAVAGTRAIAGSAGATEGLVRVPKVVG